jgi:hypothetical protein
MVDVDGHLGHTEPVVPVERPRVTPFDDLLDHLVRTTTLSRGEAVRVVGEVVAFFHEPLDVFVKRRHGELQAEGLLNPVIFAQLLDELRFVRLSAPQLTERQIRRLIYG